MHGDDIYELYAIRYGHHARRAAKNFIGGDPHDISQPLDYYVWAIVGPSRTVVVDTGFDEMVGTRRKRQIVKPVREGLLAIGIDAATIETVIVSHLHYDHSGNDDLFPRARYHLQDREMDYATGRCMCHAQLRNSYEEDCIAVMVRRVFAGRVAFHNGEDEIAPGITVHHIGGHARGLQCIRIKTRRGYVVLAADATHLYRHMDEGRIFPTTYNVAEVLEGYKTLHKLASSREHIVPGHDPLVLSRYPAAKPDLEGWIVRLDAESKGG
jgi:glyoxylase-like metal-dependent hydrolase (beta-lactamase superfamily II)